MEKFFMEEPFTEEEILTGVKTGIRERTITPCSAAAPCPASARPSF